MGILILMTLGAWITTTVIGWVQYTLDENEKEELKEKVDDIQDDIQEQHSMRGERVHPGDVES